MELQLAKIIGCRQVTWMDLSPYLLAVRTLGSILAGLQSGLYLLKLLLEPRHLCFCILRLLYTGLQLLQLLLGTLHK